MNVAGPAQPEGNHSGSRGFIGKAVDQDESAGVATNRVWIKSDRRRRRQIAEPDLVEPERSVCQMRQGLDIDAMLERGDGGRHGARSDFEQIGAARDERLVAHPDNMRGELVDTFGRLVGIREEITTRNIDIAFESKGDRIALSGAIGRALEGDNFLDPSASR